MVKTPHTMSCLLRPGGCVFSADPTLPVTSACQAHRYTKQDEVLSNPGFGHIRLGDLRKQVADNFHLLNDILVQINRKDQTLASEQMSCCWLSLVTKVLTSPETAHTSVQNFRDTSAPCKRIDHCRLPL